MYAQALSFEVTCKFANSLDQSLRLVKVHQLAHSNVLLVLLDDVPIVARSITHNVKVNIILLLLHLLHFYSGILFISFVILTVSLTASIAVFLTALRDYVAVCVHVELYNTDIRQFFIHAGRHRDRAFSRGN